MKIKTRICSIAMAVLAALAIPVGLAAQNSQGRSHQSHHYQLIDIGTLGGPQSHLAETGLPLGPAVNNGGVVAGYADTSAPDHFSLIYPTYCFTDCFVDHAFQWQNGAVTDLGPLANG